MQKITLIVTLSLTLVLACRKANDSVPLPASEQLYRTWRLTQKLYGGKPVKDSGTHQPTVTFPRNGKFLSDQPQTGSTCCNPVSFEGNNTVIRFIWDTSDPICALVNCRLSELTGGVDWAITTLTLTSLVLTSNKTVLVFEPQL